MLKLFPWRHRVRAVRFSVVGVEFRNGVHHRGLLIGRNVKMPTLSFTSPAGDLTASFTPTAEQANGAAVPGAVLTSATVKSGTATCGISAGVVTVKAPSAGTVIVALLGTNVDNSTFETDVTLVFAPVPPALATQFDPGVVTFSA